jgi:hypothetical protein
MQNVNPLGMVEEDGATIAETWLEGGVRSVNAFENLPNQTPVIARMRARDDFDP